MFALAFNDPAWYAGSLFFLTAALWLFVSRLGKERMGLRLGGLQDYAIAIIYPVAILIGVIAIMAVTGEQLNPVSLDQVYSFAGMFIIFIVLNLLTTGIFFRGWLFGFMEEKKIGAKEIIIFTSFVYCIFSVNILSIVVAPEYS